MSTGPEQACGLPAAATCCESGRCGVAIRGTTDAALAVSPIVGCEPQFWLYYSSVVNDPAIGLDACL